MTACPDISLDLGYSGVEQELRSCLRGLLTTRGGPAGVLARCESDQPYDLALWRTLAVDVGVAGLLVPERFGGCGGTVRDLAVAAEEFGRAVAPVPYLGSAVLATAALLDCPDPGPLTALATGERVATLAVPLTTPPGAAFPASIAAVDGELRGRVTSVVDLDVADVVLVPALDQDGPALYQIEPAGARARRDPVVPLDLTRRIGDLTLRGAAGTRLATGDAAVTALRAALTTAVGVLASEQLGVAQWCLDTAVAYSRTRYQFGRPIGSFQALKHRMADLWTEVIGARAVARAAAEALSTAAPDADVLLAVAGAYCSDAAVHAAEECLQLHGGIGMTWEHPLHLFLARAKADQLALGTPEQHRAALAALVELPPPTGPHP